MSDFTDTILKIIPLVGIATGWVYNHRVTSLRGKIKTDFELLEMSRAAFGSDHELSHRIQAKLQRTIPYLYRIEAEQQGSTHWGDLLLAGFCILGTIIFGVFGYLTTAGTWYRVLHLVAAASFAFVAVGAILNAVTKNRLPR